MGATIGHGGLLIFSIGGIVGIVVCSAVVGAGVGVTFARGRRHADREPGREAPPAVVPDAALVSSRVPEASRPGASSIEELVDDRTRALVEARDAAQAAVRAKMAFLANMSHEVRTPLNAIVGILDVLRLQPRSPDEAALLTAIERASEALLDLVQDTLEFARLEAGRVEIVKESCAPRAIVEGVVALLHADAAFAGLSIDAEVASDVPEAVVTDPRRLRQVLLNLVSNAIKFTPHGGVRVDVRRQGSDVLVFSVADTGIGIAAEQQQRIFEPFQQADTSMQRSNGGVGLGLAITRELVDLLGGDIDLESAPGQGSTFTFTVLAPATTPAAEIRERDVAALQDALGAGPALRCLIVEDNPVNRLVLERILRGLGIDAASVDGGAAALDACAREPYDILLLDIQMPDVDGLEVARRLRARSGERPWLIAVTAHALPEEEQAARAAGVDDYITKPVHLETVANALLRGRRARQITREAATPAASSSGVAVSV